MIMFRMSVQFSRNELIALARENHEGSKDFDEALRRCHDGFLNKLFNVIWNDLAEKYPHRDFTRGDESKTRGNLIKRIRTALKRKLTYNNEIDDLLGFSWCDETT